MGLQLCHLDGKKPGNILREQRVVQNLTQQQVADKAKITVQQYQKFESNERNIKTASFQLACRVLEALNMDIAGFVHGEYVFGEEVFFDKKGTMKYRKTNRDVCEDVLEYDASCISENFGSGR